MRNSCYLRAVTLGTGLTALFLLVRCSVPGRDYAELGIGSAANGGASGFTGEDVLHGSAGQGGQDGLGDAGGLGGDGGTAGTAPVFVPIPCSTVSDDAGDAGIGDAGTGDAGSADAGYDPCECVDGFFRAVDADGDGVRTRACSFAPGLDCDDGDPAVTHNSCEGCTALPNELGADCLDCGAYICAGSDSLVCATKPDAVVIDPDCRCQDALLVARDTDQDGWGTRLCEANPGIDCADGDNTFVTNECGGCESLVGAEGEDCNQCGVYTCSGTTLACVPKVGADGQRCENDTKVRQTCVGTGFWNYAETCVHPCVQGACAVCTPGTFRCTFYTTGDGVDACFDSSAYGIDWWPLGSCSGAALRCNPADGSCTGSLLLPRDRTFDLVPSQRGGLPWHDLLNTALDSDYG